MSRGHASSSRSPSVAIGTVLALVVALVGYALQPDSLLVTLLSSGSTASDASSLSSSSSYAPDTSSQDWSEQDAPSYYVVVGEASPDLATEVVDDVNQTTETTQGGLDVPATSQIRATYADVQEARDTERPDLPDPAMWPTNFRCEIVCPDGSFYHGWFWNRSHMVARSLGGADEARNLVAGTRMQNVGGNDGTGGMAYTETLARDYLTDNQDGWVCYRVTANYLGLERIPRTCTVEMLSDDGSLDQTVIVYNAAKGYSIDYETGEVSAA